MKRMWLVTAGGLMMMASSVLAQPGAPPDEALAAMAKLKFLVGSWQGTAVMQMRPGASDEVSQTENVESRLDGLVLVIEGIGKDRLSTQKVVHHAFAVISYDVAAKQYRVIAYRQDGQSVEAKAQFLEDGRFQWGFDVPGRSVRYLIKEAGGDWWETGEFSTDGKTWTQFMEMQLKRTS